MKRFRKRRNYTILAMVILIITQLFFNSCEKSKDDVPQQVITKEIIKEEKNKEEPIVAESTVKEDLQNYIPLISRIEIQSEPNSTADIKWEFLPEGDFILTFKSYIDETTFTRFGNWFEKDEYIFAVFNKTEPISLEALFEKYGENRKVIFTQIDEFSVKFHIYEEDSDIWGVSNSINWFEIER